MYRDLLSGIDGVSIPYPAHRGISSAHLFPIVVDAEVDRKRLIDSMREQGIQASIHYPPVHRFSYYRKQGVDARLPLTEDIASREVTLPLYPTMSETQVAQVVHAVTTSLGAVAKKAARS